MFQLDEAAALGRPPESHRGGYLVSRTEFLREEAHRMVEMVLLAESDHERTDLVALLTRCAEQAIKEKVNRDAWIRNHSIDEECADDGQTSARNYDDEQSATELTAAAPSRMMQPSADELNLAATLQAAADAASAAAAESNPAKMSAISSSSNNNAVAASPKSRASFAAGLRLERASSKINRRRKNSKETLTIPESFSVMRINNKLDPNAAHAAREDAMDLLPEGEGLKDEDGDEDAAQFEDTVVGCLGKQRMSNAAAWLEPWQHARKGAATSQSPKASAGQSAASGQAPTNGAAWELAVSSDALAVDGDLLACVGVKGCDHRSVSVCDVATGDVVQQLPQEHTERICSVAMSGDVIATGSRDRTIRLWSRTDGTWSCKATLAGSERVDEVPLCLTLLILKQGSLLLSGENTHRKIAKARLWSFHTGRGLAANGDDDNKPNALVIATDPEMLCLYAEHTEPIWSVALSRDYALTASHDSTARVWPIRYGEQGEYSQAKTPSHATLEHPDSVEGISVDGSLCATGCGDGKVRLWSLVSFTCLRSFVPPADASLKEAGVLPNSKAKAASSVLCVKLLGGICVSRSSHDGQLVVWSLASSDMGAGGGDANASDSTPAALTFDHSMPNVRAIAVSPSGYVASVGSSRTSRSLVVWRAPGPSARTQLGVAQKLSLL